MSPAATGKPLAYFRRKKINILKHTKQLCVIMNAAYKTKAQQLQI